MEWVETTGRTVEEAKEAALDELGVDEAEAEFEVLAEPRPGLFGRLRSEARVRARVQPTAPRAKEDRRDRRRRSGTGPRSGGAPANKEPQAASSAAVAKATDEPTEKPATTTATATAEPTTGTGGPSPNRRRRGGGGSRSGTSANARTGRADGQQAEDVNEEGSGVEVDLEEQGQVAEEFLRKLVAEFEVEAAVAITRPDEETLELQLTGPDLGILIGPKGATLASIQNLVRNVVHQQTQANNGHINVDIAGYRQRRSEALVRFAQQVAASVQESGTRTAMEPMSAVDRKVVHDAIAEIDGVSTISEGEDPRRRVIVLPATPEP